MLNRNTYMLYICIHMPHEQVLRKKRETPSSKITPSRRNIRPNRYRITQRKLRAIRQRKHLLRRKNRDDARRKGPGHFRGGETMNRNMKFLLLAFIAYLYFMGLAYAWLQTVSAV